MRCVAECNVFWLDDSRVAWTPRWQADRHTAGFASSTSPVPAESSLSAKSHPIAMSVDEMTVADRRFSPAPIRGRLQGDLSGVARAGETAGALHGPAGGPCAVNWIRVRSATLRENSRGRRTGLSRGQQYRRPSPHVLPGVLSVCLNHVLWNSKVPRLRNVVRAKLTG